MKTATAWYSKVLLTKPYFNEPFYVGFNIGGYELGLQPEETPVVSKPETVFAYWGVDNIENGYRRFLELRASEHEKPMNVGGEIVVASVFDLWGNIVGLIYNPEFSLG